MSLGFNQSELAEILDIKPNTVSRYETGILAVPKVVELALDAIECKQKEETQKENQDG